MKIQISFLGTSQAIPTATRNHTAILLTYNEENILVDCGEGTQRQFRKMKLNPCKLTKILLTHLHGDHILGLPGLLQTLGLNKYPKELKIFGPRGTKNLIEGIYKTFQIKERIKLEVKEVTSEVFENQDFEITALPLEHGIDCNAYIFQEKEKLRIDKKKLQKLKLPRTELKKLKALTEGKDITIDGKKIKYKDLTYSEDGKKISFVLDTRLCPNVKKAIKNSDLAIMESTYLDETELAKEYHHMTIEQATKCAKEEKVKRLILTHISQRYEYQEEKLTQRAKAIFFKTEIAKDKMQIEI